MKQMFAPIIFALTCIAPAFGAQSPLDANPACMDANGPDCVLQSVIIPAIPAGAAPASSAQSPLDANPACMQVNGPDCVIQSVTIPVRVASPPGLVTTPPPVPPVVAAPASPSEYVPGPPVVVTPAPPTETTRVPSAQGVTITVPRRQN